MPGKYDSPRDAVLHAMTIDGWANLSSGEVEAPCGWFALVHNTAEELPEILEAFETPALTDSSELIGAFIVRENDQGFVGVTRYDTRAEADVAYAELEAAYVAWDDQDEDEG